MIRIFAENYIKLGRDIENARLAYDFLKDPDTLATSLDDMASERRKCLKNIIKTCEELNLTTAQNAVSRAYDDPPQTMREFDFMLNVVLDEIKTPLVLFVPQHLARSLLGIDPTGRRSLKPKFL